MAGVKDRGQCHTRPGVSAHLHGDDEFRRKSFLLSLHTVTFHNTSTTIALSTAATAAPATPYTHTLVLDVLHCFPSTYQLSNSYHRFCLKKYYLETDIKRVRFPFASLFFWYLCVSYTPWTKWPCELLLELHLALYPGRHGGMQGEAVIENDCSF